MRSGERGNEYLPGLQALRAIAVISIVLYHARANTFPNGFLGVDLFFVISGYLVIPRMISAINTKKLSHFYLRRLLRLGPAFAAMITVMLPLILAFGSWRSHDQFLIQAFYSVFIIGNFGAYFVSGGYFTADSFMPLVHTWSLAVEEQFYILIPIIIKYFNRRIYPFLLILSFITWIIPTAFNLKSSSFLFYMLIPRIWEFGVGGIFYDLLNKYSGSFITLNLNTKLQNIYKFAIIGLEFFLLFTIKIPVILSTLSVVLLTLIAIYASKSSTNISKLFLWVGDRSYSIYLYHMPILYLAKFTYLFYSRERVIQTIIALVLTLILAHLSYEFIENRFREKTNHDD